MALSVIRNSPLQRITFPRAAARTCPGLLAPDPRQEASSLHPDFCSLKLIRENIILSHYQKNSGSFLTHCFFCLFYFYIILITFTLYLFGNAYLEALGYYSSAAVLDIYHDIIIRRCSGFETSCRCCTVFCADL